MQGNSSAASCCPARRSMCCGLQWSGERFRTQTIFQDMQVLAVDTTSGRNAGRRQTILGQAVTLAVKPEEAQKLHSASQTGETDSDRSAVRATRRRCKLRRRQAKRSRPGCTRTPGRATKPEIEATHDERTWYHDRPADPVVPATMPTAPETEAGTRGSKRTREAAEDAHADDRGRQRRGPQARATSGTRRRTTGAAGRRDVTRTELEPSGREEVPVPPARE